MCSNPLNEFYQIWLVGGVPVSHPHSKFHHCEFKNVGPQIAKIGIFWYTFAPKGYTPLKRFLRNLAWWREFQVRIVMLNFTVLTLKMWAYSRKNREKIAIFGINLPLETFWGSTEKVEYRCTTINLPLCNDTITVFKITLLHSVSVITNFVIPKRDKKQTDKKNNTISSTAGARPRIPTILGMVIDEVCPIFALL